MSPPREINSGKEKSIFFHKDLQIIYSVTLIAVMGVASISPAFPKIMEQLNLKPAQVGLLVTVFTVPGIILTLILGVYADIYGRKKILIPSLFLFAVAGAACGLTSNFNLLLIFRFLQGIGAASLGSLNITIIGDLFSGRERSSAMGFNASVLSIGTASYPLIGGGLATLSWNYPFFLPLLAIPVGILVMTSLKNPEPSEKRRLKIYLKNTFNSIKKKEALGLFIASTVTFIILYGAYLTYFPLLMGGDYKADPWVIGVILSVMSVSTAITSSQLGKLAARFSAKRLLIFSYAVYALALLIIPHICHHLWLLTIPAVIFGIAHGINLPSIQTSLASMASLEYRASFMSFNGMVLRTGQSLGPLIMGFIFGIGGMHAVFEGGAAFAILMILVLMAMMENIRMK